MRREVATRPSTSSSTSSRLRARRITSAISGLSVGLEEKWHGATTRRDMMVVVLCFYSVYSMVVHSIALSSRRTVAHGRVVPLPSGIECTAATPQLGRTSTYHPSVVHSARTRSTRFILQVLCRSGPLWPGPARDDADRWTIGERPLRVTSRDQPWQRSASLTVLACHPHSPGMRGHRLRSNAKAPPSHPNLSIIASPPPHFLSIHLLYSHFCTASCLCN